MSAATDHVVNCRSCGTRNNVPCYSFKRLPWCGTCGAALTESLQKRIARSLYQSRYLLIIIAGLGLLSIWPPAFFSIDFANLGASTKISPRIATKDVCANHTQPVQGIYARYTRHPNVAPLTLNTESGSNYFVKIEDAVSGRPVLSFYVYGGSSFETRVPSGSFILKYATGDNWCGSRELFGASTETHKADRIFQFDDDHEYTIELIARSNGNLPTKRISRDTF